MRQLKGFKLSDHTTLRVGGLATTVCEIQSPSDIQDFVHEYGIKTSLFLVGEATLLLQIMKLKQQLLICNWLILLQKPMEILLK